MSIHNPFSSDFLRSRGDDHLRPQGPLSYVAGTSDDPLKYMTISQLLDRACARHGGRPAAIFAENKLSLSWYDLRERSNDVAAGLLALGIGRGDRVGIWAPNRAEWLFTQFGTARIGAILVNINPAYRSSELEYALNKVGCKALIMARRHQARATMSRCCARVAPEIDDERRNVCKRRSCRSSSTSSCSTTDRMPRGARLFVAIDVACRSGPPRPPGRHFPRHSIRTTRSTSSSPAARPGRPKGRRSPISTSSTMRATRRRRWRSPPRTACAFRCRSITASAWCWACLPAQRSAPAWCSPARVSMPRRRCAAVARYHCTALHGVPTMFIAELEHPNFANYDLSTLRTGIMAGAPCPIETMRAGHRPHAHARSHYRLRHDRNEPDIVPIAHRRSARAARVARSAASIRMSRSRSSMRTARSCRSARPGELCTRGYGVMRGYWDDRERTRRGDRRRGLDAFGRSRDHRRAGLLQHRRAPQGHAHPRRREHLSARDRGVSDPPSEGAGRPGLRRARSAPRRGGLRLHRAQARPVGDGGGNTRSSAAARSPTTRCRATSASCRNSR